jgi:hypothetical protein
MLRLTAIAISLCLILGCENRDQPTTPPDQTYTLRAIVTALPTQKQALRLHHEPIPTFVDKTGKTIGMEEMEMEFPFLAPAAKLDGIAVNDPIEATMEMRWNAKQAYLLTKIHKLPTDTKLKIHPLEPDK